MRRLFMTRAYFCCKARPTAMGSAWTVSNSETAIQRTTHFLFRRFALAIVVTGAITTVLSS
jgi:hypothetical protein